MEPALVSCLMVTSGTRERLRWIECAIHNYCRQSYTNTELIVVLDLQLMSCRDALARIIATAGRVDIKLIEPTRALTLGALRNLSMDAARGEYVCVWDDDDVYHHRRIELQLTHLQAHGQDAVVLGDCFHIFLEQRRCYWTNWSRTTHRGLPGSLFVRRDHGLRYPESGVCSRSGEDSDLLLRLLAVAHTGVTMAPPVLYAYQFHGRNTWPLMHHVRVACSLSEDRSQLELNRSMLECGLRELALSIPSVTMCDRNGPVFTVSLDQSATHQA